MNNKFKTVKEIIAERAKFVAKKPKSGFKGVYNRNGRFESYFCTSDSSKNKIKIHLGVYDTAEDAYKARLMFIDSLK